MVIEGDERIGDARIGDRDGDDDRRGFSGLLRGLGAVHRVLDT